MDVVLLSSCVTSQSTSAALMRPRGCYQIAWYLRKHNYSVQVLEYLFKFTESQILELIDKFVTKDTKIIGLGMMLSTTDITMGSMIKKFENVLHQSKKKYPWVKIICGGANSTFWSRMHRNQTLFNYIFTGHAEDTCLALCNHLFRGDAHPRFELVDGNKFIREKFKMPHDDLFNIEESDNLWHDSDCIQPHEVLPLELSRGCIFKCKFCRYPYIGKQKNDFNRNMECVKNELLDNYNKWGTRAYYMLDDTFNSDQERIRKFHDMVQTLPFKIEYVTYLRPDLLASHPDSQYHLLESGLRSAFLGIETFNKEASILIDKPWSGTKAKDYLPKLYHDIWKKQVNPQVGMICGLPPETLDECLASGKYLTDVGIPGILWQPLYVSRNSFNEYLSEFDRNSEKYGFEWEVRYGTPIWKTKYCDAMTAKEWRRTLIFQSRMKIKLSGWEFIELVNYGYNLQELLNVTSYNFYIAQREDINSRRDKFLSNYLEDLKKHYP
jgi:radical SAM superfamily enzyme YgiQ (UPF0313 family)